MNAVKILNNLKRKIQKYDKPPYLWGGFITAAAVLDVLDFAEYFCRTSLNLLDRWEIKTVGSAVLMWLLTFLDSTYGIVLNAYFWLIVVDISTRWLAIGFQFLTDKGMDPAYLTTREKLYGIVLAFNAKRLKSKIMLWGFLTKFILFTILIFAAYQIDTVLSVIEIPLSWPVLKFMFGYICYNEILSICENLRDAGNHHIDKLITLLDNNIFAKLKK